MKPFSLGSAVSLADLAEVAAGGRPVRLDLAARRRVLASRARLEKLAASGRAIYGVNTGFGELASVRIAPEDERALQYNLIRSHASGVGEPLSPAESRAIVFLRANELARGYSGCRPAVIDALAAMLNRGVTPVIPSRGSVGASGDLAPQAHAALVAIGEGQAWVGEKADFIDGGRALKKARLKPIVLHAKEGLSLVNGTQAMQSVGGLALADARRVFHAAQLAGAMSLEAIMGTPVPFEEAVSRLKAHPGQKAAAAQMRALLRASEIRESHLENDNRVQDPYSFRCIPQVHGAVLDSLAWAEAAVEREMGSVTDNPIVIGSRVISGGNFHGQALSFAFDAAAAALTALGNISERRIAQLVSGQHGLELFLADRPGLESGFMIPQVAAAALASENKTLAHPASADSIPTSAEKEDFVSMGMGAALKLKQVVENAASIVGIELLAAAKGVEMRRPLRAGRGVERGLERLRAAVAAIEGDQPFHGRIEAAADLILSGAFEGSL